MALRITIDIFSGRPNPVIELSEGESKRILERLRPARPLKRTEPRLPPFSTLGYRGLVIEQTGAPTRGLPKVFRFAHGDVFGPELAHRAADYRTDTFAQPGLAAGAEYTALTCAAVRPAAIADCLINAPGANNKCPREGHLVALVIAPGIDFHWYRKGRNGYWSDKPGPTQVTNVDNSGVLIPDPRTANRGPYTNFCTFMVVMHGHVKIR